MVSYIRRMTVEGKRWLDDKTFADGVALCQTIPGATAMQVAAYVGLRARGLAGAGATFVGFGLPAFSLMIALSAIYTRTYSLPGVVSVFHGLQAAVVAIVANATLSFGRTSIRKWQDFFFAAFAAGMFGLKMSPILVILISGVLAVGFFDRRAVSSEAGPPATAGPFKYLFPLFVVAAAGFALLFFVDRALFDLAALMLRIDLFAFGGGFASVPLMFHEIVEVRGWLEPGTFLDGIALGQVTPGPIVITATFIGYLLYGLIGGVIATIGVFLSSFLILVTIVPYFDRIRASAAFNKAIRGVLNSFVGLLFTVTYRFALNMTWDVSLALVASAAFVALLVEVEIIWVVLTVIFVSVVVL